MFRPVSTLVLIVGTISPVSIFDQNTCADHAVAHVASADANAQGVLLLHGGGVLEGSIELVGGRYHVSRANSAFDIAADKVLLTAGSITEAYELQRQQLPRESVEARLALVEWCLRNDLLSEARRELADVRSLDQHHPKLALLERHVAAAELAAADCPPIAPSIKTELESPRDDLRTLEALAADLPAAVVERFTRKVQPLLVNNCTTAGCHQPGGDQEYQLDRALLHGLANRRTTLRNLAATLALVDRSRPHVSPLLTVPRQSHGGMRRPLFGPRQEAQLNQLIDWVVMITQADRGVPLAATSAARISPPSVKLVAHEEEPPTLRPKTPLRYGAEVTAWQPKDPFDPEIFNRQDQARGGARSSAIVPGEVQPVER
jgi:hypothetical protein